MRGGRCVSEGNSLLVSVSACVEGCDWLVVTEFSLLESPFVPSDGKDSETIRYNPNSITTQISS